MKLEQELRVLKASYDEEILLKYNMMKYQNKCKLLQNKLSKIENGINGQLSHLNTISNEYHKIGQIMDISNTDKNDNKLSQSLIQNNELLKTIQQNIKYALSDDESDIGKVQDLEPIKPIDLVSHIKELQQESIKTIKSNNVSDKNQTIDKTQDLLTKLKQTKANNQSTTENIILSATSYLSDTHPLVPAVLILYVSIINNLQQYFNVKQCDAMYQMLQWFVLIIMMLYLTLIGWRISKFRSRPTLFFKEFWSNYVIFILLVTIQTSFPPLPCYIHNKQYITMIATILSAIFAVIMILIKSPWAKYYYSKCVKGKTYYSKPHGIYKFDSDETGANVVSLPDMIIESKSGEPGYYINKIEFNPGNKYGIEIVSLELNGSDENFDGSVKDKQNEYEMRVINYMDSNQQDQNKNVPNEDTKEEMDSNGGKDDEKDEDEDQEEHKYDIIDVEIENTENIIDKKYDINQKIERMKSYENEAKSLYGAASGFVALDKDNKNEDETKFDLNNANWIHFRKDECCTKVTIFSKKNMRNKQIETIIGLRFTTNKNNEYCLGKKILDLNDDVKKYRVDSYLIDPNLEDNDYKEYALAQITCYKDQHNESIIGVSFAFIVMNKMNDKDIVLNIENKETTPLNKTQIKSYIS